MGFKLFKRSRPPKYEQLDSMDCGPTCLMIICAFYGSKKTLQSLRELTRVSRFGVSLFNLKKTAETLGFTAISIKTSIDKIAQDCTLPCILHWDNNHYVVLYKIKKNTFYILDPAVGYIKYNKESFIELWQNQGANGVALLLEPQELFYSKTVSQNKDVRTFGTIYNYLKKYRVLFFQLLIGLIATTAIQFSFPFFTQNIVDKGINKKDINLILLIVIGQSVLVASRMGVDFLRGWVLLHISLRVNLSLISEFLKRLMKLPLSFFDTKNVGDIFQRINDHKRIENFITLTTLNTFFSFVSFIVFSIVLFSYSKKIFLIFILASLLYFVWSLLFLKKRKELDYKKFGLSSKNQNVLLQLIEGMADIKLNNADAKKRADWEDNQASLYKLNTQTLLWVQTQQSGAFLINEIKNIFIVGVSAFGVIKGEISLGTMMAIQYIIGQLNSPINQFISVIQTIQEAKISMDRINEIHTFENESIEGKEYKTDFESGNIRLSNISFSYPGQNNPVLKNINLSIEKGKTTAIVGTSGSGKTSLLKILLKFYNPQNGTIHLEDNLFSDIDIQEWRKRCGAVLQDGFIFSDTIARNIAPEAFDLDYQKLDNAVYVSNLNSFIENLPSGLEFKIGAEGSGVSQGQKQRILIARSIYKDPDYLFFDEATNALDANNEKIIIERLSEFLVNKTVIVVAHRLSTVKNADKIVVLEDGQIVEEGTHIELSELKGKYFELVKNQLELSQT